MKTVPELVAAGRPHAGFACTHDPIERTLEEAGGLAFGMPNGSQVERGYEWKRWSGRTRLAVGAAKGKHGNRVGVAIPAVIATAIDSLAGEKMGEATNGAIAKISAMAYSDVLLLLIDRLVTRGKGSMPTIPGMECVSCGRPLASRVDVPRSLLRLAYIEWTPAAPPRSVCWLDTPFDYGKESIIACIVEQATWRSMFGEAEQGDLLNPEWTTVQSATTTTVGAVTVTGEILDAPIPSAVLLDMLDGDELDRMSEASYACSGGMQMAAMVPHDCGGEAIVPFDWTAAL